MKKFVAFYDLEGDQLILEKIPKGVRVWIGERAPRIYRAKSGVYGYLRNVYELNGVPFAPCSPLQTKVRKDLEQNYQSRENRHGHLLYADVRRQGLGDIQPCIESSSGIRKSRINN